MIKIIKTFSYFCFIFILLNNLICFACQDRPKSSSVKANMHTFQIMLETFALENGGVYPKNIDDLKNDANKRGYWKRMVNPYNFKETIVLKDFFIEQNLDSKLVEKEKYTEGTILYSPINNKETGFFNNYKIYGIIKTYPYQSSIRTFLNGFLDTINIFSYLSACGPLKTDFFSYKVNDFVFDKGKIWYLTNH
jgi:hypothetical protein